MAATVIRTGVMGATAAITGATLDMNMAIQATAMADIRAPTATVIPTGQAMEMAIPTGRATVTAIRPVMAAMATTVTVTAAAIRRQALLPAVRPVRQSAA